MKMNKKIKRYNKPRTTDSLIKIFYISFLIALTIGIIIASFFMYNFKDSIEKQADDSEVIISHAELKPTPESDVISLECKEEIEPEVVEYSREFSEEDKYLLAKITMAEAGTESLETKIFVIFTILNRVESDYFPDTIEEVVYENHNGVYQFTPTASEKWNKVEPNEECWEAVEIANSIEHDPSGGALFFEACKGESWHSRNLELICQSDSVRFYK